MPESYVDFRLVTIVDPVFADKFRKVASLTEEGRLSFRRQLILSVLDSVGTFAKHLRPLGTFSGLTQGKQGIDSL